VKINELSEVYDEMREEVFQQTKKVHTIDVGWIIQSFHKNDRIDDNFELYQLGDTSDERREAWLKSDETYLERRAEQYEQERKAA
jgi:hypothetical protein